jgi:hypothetical protein
MTRYRSDFELSYNEKNSVELSLFKYLGVGLGFGVILAPQTFLFFILF